MQVHRLQINNRQLAVLVRIHDLIKDNSQFVFAIHPPILMAHPGAWIYHLSADGIERLDYYETEHYHVMHDFMANSKWMLNFLFETSED